MFNVKTNRISTVAILFTDIALLLIMLIGLLRMRTRSRRFLPFRTHPLESGAVVAVRAVCDTPKLTNMNSCSSGHRLAFYCQSPRSPRWYVYSFWPFLFVHRHFTSQVFMALNLNGSILFPLIHQKRALIKHYSNEPTRASRHGTFLFTTSGDWKG